MTGRLGAWVPCLVAAWLAGAANPASAQVRSWPSERPPKPLPARGFTFPSYDLRTLPNGLQVVVVPHHEQPAVTLQLLVRAGSAQDPADRAGVAGMAAALLDQGTTSRAAREIADAIDSIGGTLEVLTGTDLTFARVAVMKDSFGAALELLSDICRAPAFSDDELTRQRQQLRSALRVSYDDPDHVADATFKRVVYGLHPYGLPGSGTPASIERITRDDLVRFHERYFVPNNSLLAVVGDVSADEAMSQVERVLGDWLRRDVPDQSGLDPPAPERRVVVIDRPEAVQTEIRVGHVAIARADRDYLALEMAVRVLGGEGANRVQQILRMNRGLTYGASADLQAYRVSGDIAVATDTRSETTGEAVRVVIDEFSKLRREAVRERELDDVKAYMTGSFPIGIETPVAISTQVLNALFYGLPLRELQDYRDRVNAVTPDGIQYVTRAHLRPDRLTVVLVGNYAAFRNQLRGVGLRDVQVVPITKLDLEAADLRAAVPAPAVPGEPPQSPPVRPAADPVRTKIPDARPSDADAILARAVGAAGGADALKRIRTVRATALTTLHTPEGPLQTRTTTWVEYPSRVRVEALTPTGLFIQAYNDGHAWIQDAKGARDAPDAMRDAFAVSARRDWIALVRAAVEKRLSARTIPASTGTAGRPLVGLELSGEDLPATRLYIDAETAELARLVYDTAGPRGKETTTEVFSDFRQVEGVAVPFKAVVQRDGAPLLERTITGLVFNDPIPAAVFEKPRGTGPAR